MGNIVRRHNFCGDANIGGYKVRPQFFTRKGFTSKTGSKNDLNKEKS